ncbi:hypothetical protein [Neorhizobium alkalisoli]|jgi:hypothetical protein|uniref:Uncharacterized protein n=1 Tax=Neorhizobium alkalisoli TaxID=528178 RepID=A0A561QX02_9HYPH|nr:hypothetical protein [Neorhizobium alkalisoli]TWF54873.1 hypothetical protein FHW37_103744 [Neorhizobium alkalisoli]
MTRRLRNISFAVAVSLGMWAVIIHGTLSVYAAVHGPSTDTYVTASVK